MSAGRLLLQGHLRTRWRRQLLLGISLAAGLVGYLLVAMVLQGAQEGVVQPVHDLLTGDVRVTWGGNELAGGRTLDDHRVAGAPIAGLAGAVVAPRWETSQVSVRSAVPENWTGGLLVGLDPRIPEETRGMAPYLTWGRALSADSLVDPATGRVYAQLVVGEAAARRLNLTRTADGQPDFTQVLQVTSGRFLRPNDLRPLSVEAVVVGTFATGIDSMDRFTAFTSIEETRRLVGGRPGDPSANTLVVHHADVADVAALGLPDAEAEDARMFALQVMGSFLLMLRIASGLAVALVLGVLGVWLTHEVGATVARDRPVVAALRAVGIPFRSLLQGYAGLVALTVGAALAAALLVGLLVWALAPPLRFDTSQLHLSIPWALRPAPVASAAAAAIALSALSTWAAARRLQKVDVADALRPT